MRGTFHKKVNNYILRLDNLSIYGRITGFGGLAGVTAGLIILG